MFAGTAKEQARWLMAGAQGFIVRSDGAVESKSVE